MQETRNNCFESKNNSTTFHQKKIGKHECRNVTLWMLVTPALVGAGYVDVTFWHSWLPIFTWRRVVLHFFDPKQLLQVFLHLIELLFKMLLNHNKIEICTRKLACIFWMIKVLVANPGINFTSLCIDSFCSFNHVHQNYRNNICYGNYDAYNSSNYLDKRMHILIFFQKSFFKYWFIWLVQIFGKMMFRCCNMQKKSKF